MDDHQPSLSRRDLLRGGPLQSFFRGFIDHVTEPLEGLGSRGGASLEPLPVALRPPGAIAEAAFMETCTRCGDCLSACPHDAIINAPDRLRAASGTPIIDPYTRACHACPETPCIPACTTGALVPEAGVRMGTAQFIQHECLVWQNLICTTCVEHCPVDGAILTTMGRLAIDAAKCTGCGLCVEVCPAPQKAVMVLAERNRPQPAANDKLHG